MDGGAHAVLKWTRPTRRDFRRRLIRSGGRAGSKGAQLVTSFFEAVLLCNPCHGYTVPIPYLRRMALAVFATARRAARRVAVAWLGAWELGARPGAEAPGRRRDKC